MGLSMIFCQINLFDFPPIMLAHADDARQIPIYYPCTGSQIFCLQLLAVYRLLSQAHCPKVEL